MSMHIRVLVRFALLTLLIPTVVTALLLGVFALTAHMQPEVTMHDLPWGFILMCAGLSALGGGGLAAEDLMDQRTKRAAHTREARDAEKARRRNISALKQAGLWDYDRKCAVYKVH